MAGHKGTNKFVTGGNIVYAALNGRMDLETSLTSLVETIRTSREEGNERQYNESVRELLTALAQTGKVKRMSDQVQYGLLEEAFAFANED